MAVVASGAIIAATTGSQHTTVTAKRPAPTSAAPSSTTTTPPAPPIVAVDALPALLLDATTVNTIMGATGMAVEPNSTTTYLYIDTTDKPECGGVYVNGARVAYAGSGWIASQSEYLREPGEDFQHYLSQSVVTFPTAEAAAKFVETESNRWRKCDGASLSNNEPDAPHHDTWSVTNVSHQDQILTAQQTLEGGNGFGCQRALTSRNNVVIDTRGCALNAGNSAAVAARKIADRVATH